MNYKYNTNHKKVYRSIKELGLKCPICIKKYLHALKNCGKTQSVSWEGNSYDDAVIEKFLGIMKSGFLFRKKLKI